MGKPNKLTGVDKDAVKALVTVYGPREAARIAGIKPGTIFWWCKRYSWKKARSGAVTPPAIAGKDAGDVLKECLEKSREASTLNLAKYTEKASKKAAEHTDPLSVARKVRDVAGVYSTLWPVEEHSELIDGAILVGQAQVTENVEEKVALAREIDVRAELSE